MSLSSDLDRFDYMVRNYSLAILARVDQLNNENNL